MGEGAGWGQVQVGDVVGGEEGGVVAASGGEANFVAGLGLEDGEIDGGVDDAVTERVDVVEEMQDAHGGVVMGLVSFGRREAGVAVAAG